MGSVSELFWKWVRREDFCWWWWWRWRSGSQCAVHVELQLSSVSQGAPWSSSARWTSSCASASAEWRSGAHSGCTSQAGWIQHRKERKRKKTRMLLLFSLRFVKWNVRCGALCHASLCAPAGWEQRDGELYPCARGASQVPVNCYLKTIKKREDKRRNASVFWCELCRSSCPVDVAPWR